MIYDAWATGQTVKEFQEECVKYQATLFCKTEDTIHCRKIWFMFICACKGLRSWK